ncbi:hypothetical protein L6164_009439 [Bauhinia variegata]|uniref:Uncharacterized protein n=1 Tax=Bauhinia variegata TaxID=167791 RepID=A0ACB9PJR9_BAUVA|nr:hypothetical protein L6164_009439 [Bauhinia variegata]
MKPGRSPFHQMLFLPWPGTVLEVKHREKRTQEKLNYKGTLRDEKHTHQKVSSLSIVPEATPQRRRCHPSCSRSQFLLGRVQVQCSQYLQLQFQKPVSNSHQSDQGIRTSSVT